MLFTLHQVGERAEKLKHILEISTSSDIGSQPPDSGPGQRRLSHHDARSQPQPRSPGVHNINGFHKSFELHNNSSSSANFSGKPRRPSSVAVTKEEKAEESYDWRANLIKMREQIKAVQELPSISAPDPAKYDESSRSYVQSLHVLIIISDITARTQAQPPRQT